MTWPEPPQPWADWLLVLVIAAVILCLGWGTSHVFNALMGVLL